MRLVSYTLVAILFVIPSHAQQMDRSALEEIARAELVETKTPGCAIAVVLGDRVVYVQGIGVASVETEAPVTPDMLFRLGSTTKMFTAAAVLSLAATGKVSLHEPIAGRIPGIPPQLAAVTPHQLLTHTAGIRDEAPMFGRQDDDALGNGIRAWTPDYFLLVPGSDARALFLYRGTRALRRVESADAFAEIDRLTRAELAKDNLGSVTVGVVSSGKLAWTRSYGLADMERNEPATPDHVYRIGSITKQFTGLMLLQLVEKNRVRLSDPVEMYLPEIRHVKGELKTAPPITLVQLATMTAGLDREPRDLPVYLKGPVGDWEKVALRAAEQTAYAYEPGTRYHYSNIGYALLGASLSRAAGTPYLDYVRERILRPLGMSASDFELLPTLRSHLAKGYAVGNGKVDADTPAREHEGRGYKVPNGALYTTVGDLARFVIFELGGGPETLLEKKTLDENLARLSSATGDLTSGYGIGFQSTRRGELVARGHSGSVAGYQAAACFDIESRTGVVVLRNVSGGAFNVTGLALSALEILARSTPLP